MRATNAVQANNDLAAWRYAKLNLYLNNLSWTYSGIPKKTSAAHYLGEWRCTRIHHEATNKRTFLDISRPLERALALINFAAATKTEELITSFSMHSREPLSLSLAFPELAPYISSRLSSCIEMRERASTLHTYTHDSTCNALLKLYEHEAAAPATYLSGKLMKCKVFRVVNQPSLARYDTSTLIRGDTVYRFHSNELTSN